MRNLSSLWLLTFKLPDFFATCIQVLSLAVMGPARKSRSVNKRYSSTPDVSPSKDGDGAKRSNSRVSFW